MTTTLPPGPTRSPRRFGIDPRLGAAVLRAPAASKEDSHPQAILKFQSRKSFDYRVCYEPQLPIEVWTISDVVASGLDFSLARKYLKVWLFTPVLEHLSVEGDDRVSVSVELHATVDLE